MILDNNVYFIESENIKVFPCAYRGQNSKGETYNIESKLSTERNLTNFGKADTYIESFKADSLTVYIKGYRFEITSTGLKAFLTDNSLHVIGIRLIDQAITADAKDTTKRLGSFHKISDSANNTVYDSALDTTINTADCFTGLVFATETALESTDYTDAIKILEDANGMGRDKSGGYLPKTQSNSNIGDFMTAIDPTFSGVKGEDILTSNSLIKDEKFTDLGNYKDYFSSRLSTPFYGAGTDYSVVLGGKSAAGLIGSSAFAAGTGNFAIKTNSAAFGLNNAVAGENSLVSGKANFEYGLNNLVSGNNNCVNGSNNIISGTENSILGNNCFVSGVTNKIESNVNNSMLFGGYNVASAAGTVAFGKGLIVNNNTKAAFGNFNKGTCLFEIGNGASDTDRKTIFSVDAYGNVNSAANIAAAGNISLGNTLTVGTDTKFNNINNAVKGSLTVNKTADDELDFTIGEKTIYNLKYDGTSSRTRLNGGLAYGGNSIAIGKYSSAIGRNAIAIGSDEFNSTTHTDVTTLFNNPEIQATLAKAIDAEYGVTISNIKSIIYEKGTSSLYKVGWQLAIKSTNSSYDLDNLGYITAVYVVNGYTALIVKSIDKDYWVEPDSESMSPEGGGGEGSSSGGAPYYVPATVIMSAAADDNQIVIGKYDSATGHNAVTIDLQNNYENNYFNGTAKTAEQLKDSSEITGVVKTGFGSYIGEATASSSSSSSSPRHNGYYFIGQKLVQTASDKLYLLPGTVFTTNIEQYCSTSTMDVMLSSYLRKGGIYLVTSDAESGSGDSYMTGKYAVLCCIDTGTHQPYSSTLHSFEHENVKFIVLAAPISYYNEHPITSSYSYYIYPIEYYYTDTFAGSSIRRIVTTAVE